MMKKTIDLTSHPNPALFKMEQNDGQPRRGETRKRETKGLNDPKWIWREKGGRNWNIPEERFLY